MSFTIRSAHPGDAEAVCGLIRELAAYEKLSHEAHPDPDAVRQHLAPGASPRCEALLAVDDASGEVFGFALFFPNYSTFLTRWGIYLEDLFVRPDHRGRGAGLALLRAVAERVVQRGGSRLDWSVLDWNTLAIDFYRKLGARPMNDWTTFRLDGEALKRFADG